ncbi:MAG TPA: hypothetical protein VJO12_01095 [Stellaceae bacterium]|nr:hypothetical protein [Stellaceae bacterium]
MNRDKRASLSSGLLASKDAALATGDGTSSAGTAASSDTAKAESRANVLYTKGAASASGFRPDQWSFDGQAAVAPPASDPVPVPEPLRLVMPFPAKAIAAAPVPVVVPRRMVTARTLGLGAGTIAVVACVALGIGLVARPSQRASAPVATLPAAPTTATVTLAPPVPAAAPDAVSADELAELMARADQLVATGDIVAARGFYERAAEHGRAPAMTAAGKTYDPLFLEETRVRGSRGDAGKAAEWYRRAEAAGDAEAAQRLKRLIARYAG